MNTENILFAFALTISVGLATGIGSVIAFTGKTDNKKYLPISLGFGSGVMLFAAFAELFPESKETLVNIFGEEKGFLISIIAFFIGMVFMVFTEKFCFHEHNDKKCNHCQNEKHALYQVGIMTAIAISIHNFPEGIAIFTSAMTNKTLGFSIAAAIAIHNIAVGIAISAPVYYGTEDKKKAFLISIITGLTEPFGALVGFILFKNYMNEAFLGILLGIVAGIMVYISLDELLPSAQKGSNHHMATYSMILGMIVMGICFVFI